MKTPRPFAYVNVSGSHAEGSQSLLPAQIKIEPYMIILIASMFYVAPHFPSHCLSIIQIENAFSTCTLPFIHEDR